ncbi:MAG: hypothetical protein ACO1OF_04955 [Adhaeribacter sp.]
MELKDLFLTPVYLILIYGIAYWLRPKFTNKLTKKYFIPALTVKIIGAIAVGLIYYFYYGGGRSSGDTFRYFNHSKVMLEAFSNSFSDGIGLLFSNRENIDPNLLKYSNRMFLFRDKSSFFIVKITTIFGLISFSTYSVIACFFALTSFFGVFAMYSAFTRMYPLLHKQLAYAILFLPSLFFWGSGILKDSVTLGALGLLFYCFYTGFVRKENIFKCLLLALLAAFLLQATKVYILLCFLPAVVLWVFIQQSKNIKSTFFKVIATPILLLLGGIGAYFLTTSLSAGTEYGSLEDISAKTKVTADYVYLMSEQSGGSSYYLGELDGTFAGMLKLAPQAVIVSIFRPFLWEVRNPVMLLSALESFYLLFLTLSIIFKVGFIKLVRFIASQPLLTLCFVFSIVFAFAVGVSTNNFGSLVRYRIPLLPFYLSAVLIIKHLTSKKQTHQKTY